MAKRDEMQYVAIMPLKAFPWINQIIRDHDISTKKYIYIPFNAFSINDVVLLLYLVYMYMVTQLPCPSLREFSASVV